MSFANQVAVVTGASSGIGWALAKRLAAEGCKVGLWHDGASSWKSWPTKSRRPAARRRSPPRTWPTANQTLKAIHEVAGTLGPVDLLVANAGVGAPTNLDPVNIGDVEKMFQVNTLGVIYAIEAVLPEMLKRGRGHLAAVSSLAAYKGLPGESAYCASKAAVNVYMEGLRIQLRDKGIAVTTVCPGFVKTPMTEINDFKMPFLMDADEAARRIVWALRPAAEGLQLPVADGA